MDLAVAHLEGAHELHRHRDAVHGPAVAPLGEHPVAVGRRPQHVALHALAGDELHEPVEEVLLAFDQPLRLVLVPDVVGQQAEEPLDDVGVLGADRPVDRGQEVLHQRHVVVAHTVIPL